MTGWKIVDQGKIIIHFFFSKYLFLKISKEVQYLFFRIHLNIKLALRKPDFKFSDRGVEDVKDGYVSCEPFQVLVDTLKSELKKLEMWISRSVLDLLFLLIIRFD